MADLFDIVTARKLSGGGGGGTTVEALSVTQNGTYTAPSGKAYSPVIVNVSGGSSDFSTAEVTVVNNASMPFELYMPCTVDDDSEDYYTSTYSFYAEPNNTVQNQVILYKGECLAFIKTAPYQVTISGDIDDDGASYYIITGDCTITIS